MSKSITFIGSCLTGSTLASVESEYKLLGIYRHLRTDFIINALDGKLVGIPREKLESLFNSLIARPDERIPEKMLGNRLRKQFTERLMMLEKHLAAADIIVMDTNYDFGRQLNTVLYDGIYYNFSNLGLNSSEICVNSDSLTTEEMCHSVGQLLKRIESINPTTKIIFFNYPATGFRKRNDDPAKLRIELVNGLSKWLQKENAAGSLPANLTAIDCTEVPEKMLSEMGALYFQPPVYDAFGKVISQIIEESWQGPAYINGFSTLLRHLSGAPEDRSSAETADIATPNPYSSLPERQYWKPAVADPYPLSISGLYEKRYEISISDAIATCGSCFAQHIGRRLAARGHNYVDMEPAPSGMAAKEASSLGYGIYSARYGNVYTSRQLLQLFKRAFGELEFNEVWQNSTGRYVDPFRPNLCGNGWETASEVLDAQRSHLQNVRKMFENLDVFVFTMGLTETWQNRQTGAAYPICPGVTAGRFDPDLHEFVNLDYATIIQEMEEFLQGLQQVNPNARILLTVSPVPLTATAETRHVLISTMASKSILRAVADQIYRNHDRVDYFPSYDIIMSPPYKAMFFKNNLRNIHEEGVDHVMSHFFAQHGQSANSESVENFNEELFCDESFLELSRKVAEPA